MTGENTNNGRFCLKISYKKFSAGIILPTGKQSRIKTIIGTILADNPWGCTPYTSGGETLPAVSKSSEYYSGTIVYENNDGKQVGRIAVRAPSGSGFDTTVTNVLAEEALETAMGGVGSHNSSEDGFSVTLKCHAANGELYNVTFKRDKVLVSIYESDAVCHNRDLGRYHSGTSLSGWDSRKRWCYGE